MYLVLNAPRWVLHECKPGCYTYEVLMELNIARVYNYSATKVQELAADAGKTFVERWKGPTCNDVKRQKEPHSIEHCIFHATSTKGRSTRFRGIQWDCRVSCAV
jgi:hypothetical protein